MFNAPIEREYCELKSWRSLQDSLLEQIISRKRDFNKNILREKMEMFSIPEYLKKINDIDAEHEKRLKQNKEWQVLQKKNLAVNKNIGDGIKSRLRRKDVSSKKNKLISGEERKHKAKKQKKHVSKPSVRKVVAKFKKNKIHPTSQQFFRIGTPSKSVSYSHSKNSFLITKLSSSTTLIKKLPAPEISVGKSQLLFLKPRNLPALYPRKQTEISSKTSSLLLDRLNVCPEITPGTTDTINDPCSLSLSKIPRTHHKLSFNSNKSSQPIRQYRSSIKNSRKSSESASSQWPIESISLSGNSPTTSTEKTEFCSSEMMSETFSSLLTKPSFHREWTEPEVYYTPKFTENLTDCHDHSLSDQMNLFHSIQLNESSILSPNYTVSSLSFGEV